MMPFRDLMVLVLACWALGGCASVTPPRLSVPEALARSASVPHILQARHWGDDVPTNNREEIRKLLPNVPNLARDAVRINGRPVISILALSGGGADGAFGAGVITGWTARGTRPEFQIVTGVSAGALIAPLAFLGPKYDKILREIWTVYDSKDLIRSNGALGLLNGDSLADTGPLRKLIARYYSRAVLNEIASQYQRGRSLFVLTTNLDAQRPVVWNLGAIASSKHPSALALFHDVILASAALPAIFSPVRIRVKANGKLYDELHVDGGTTREIFISPIQGPLHLFDQFYDRPPLMQVFLIKNGKLTPIYKNTEQKTFPIAGRAISTLLLNQSEGAIYRIYRRVLDAEGDFSMISIPPTFPYRPIEAFDPDYQSKLFNVGTEMGKTGKGWKNVPPELTPTVQRTLPVTTRPVKAAKAAAKAFESSSFFGGLDSLR